MTVLVKQARVDFPLKQKMTGSGGGKHIELHIIYNL